MSGSWIVYVAVMAAYAFVFGQTAVVSQPEDVAILSGSDVKLNCTITDNTPLTWTHIRPGSTITNTIFLSITGDISNPEKHAITGRYDLTVKKVDPFDGGIYNCITLEKPNVKMSAELSVFKPTTCGTRHMAITEGDSITIFCNSVYGAESAPTLYFSDLTSDLATVVTNGSNSVSQFVTMEASMLVTSEDNGREFVCHVALASPGYSDNCTLRLNVQYYPKNITIYSDTDYFYVGEEIKCNATGNPKPTMHWQNQNNTVNETIRGDTFTVTSQMMGNNTWRCFASNSINGTTNSTYIDFNFYVGDGLRTTMRPVSTGFKIETTFSALILCILISQLFH